MAPESAPPSKTFAERWPDDAAEADYLAGPWIPVAAGGLASLVALPIILGQVLRIAPLPFLLIAGGIIVIATLAMTRATGKARRRAGRAWKFGFWISLAAVVGVVLDRLSTVICDAACRAAAGPADPDRMGPTLVSMVALVASSIALAILANRAGDRLVGPLRRP